MQGSLTQSWELQKEKRKQQSGGLALAVPPAVKQAETPGGGHGAVEVTVATSNRYSESWILSLFVCACVCVCRGGGVLHIPHWAQIHFFNEDGLEFLSSCLHLQSAEIISVCHHGLIILSLVDDWFPPSDAELCSPPGRQETPVPKFPTFRRKKCPYVLYFIFSFPAGRGQT